MTQTSNLSNQSNATMTTAATDVTRFDDANAPTTLADLNTDHSDFDDDSDGFIQAQNAAQGLAAPSVLQQSMTISDAQAGERIDKVASHWLADFSREQVKDWLNDGALTINGMTQKPKYRVKAGDVVALYATLQAAQADLPENIPLDIVFEDAYLLVVNKPAGLVVHPGAGNWTGTLVNALLYHYPDSRVLPRAGLVHRIDKDTTGLLIIAKDHKTQLALIAQLKDKTVYRRYQALALADTDTLASLPRTIDAPIGRHASQRTKMAVTSSGKPAVTHVDQLTPITDGLVLADLRLETGRTHQIRVHLAHIGCPLLGDPVYGSTRQTAKLCKNLNTAQQTQVNDFARQALHAYELGFVHPITGQAVRVQAALAADMQAWIDVLTKKD